MQVQNEFSLSVSDTHSESNRFLGQLFNKQLDSDDGACPRAESDGNEPDSLIYHKATNKRKCFFFFFYLVLRLQIGKYQSDLYCFIHASLSNYIL